MKTAMLASILSLMFLATAVALADEPAPAPAPEPAPAPQEESCEELIRQYEAKRAEEERICRPNHWSRACIKAGREMEALENKIDAKGCVPADEE